MSLTPLSRRPVHWGVRTVHVTLAAIVAARAIAVQTFTHLGCGVVAALRRGVGARYRVAGQRVPGGLNSLSRWRNRRKTAARS